MSYNSILTLSAWSGFHIQKGLIPTRLPPFQRPITSVKSPYFWPTSYKSGVPNDPLLSSHNFLEQLLTGLRKPLFLHLPLSTKDTNKQPDKEVHGARFRKVPNPGASVLMELGYTILPAQARVQQLRNSMNFTEEFLCRLYYIGWAD